MKAQGVANLCLLSLLSLPGLQPQAWAACRAEQGDQWLYDGEPGSAPLLGGNWAVGSQGAIYRQDGMAWTAVGSPTDNTLLAVAAAGDLDIRAAGTDGTLLRFDPLSLTWSLDTVPLDRTITALAVQNGHDWAVGSGGLVLEDDGNGWQVVDAGVGPGDDLFGVAVLDASHVWVVGSGGLIRFYDGTAWQSQDSGTSVTLHSVFASSVDEIWAVGDCGTLLQKEGELWQPIATGIDTALFDVWAEPPQVWAVGAQGVILHGNANDWGTDVSGTNATLFAVDGAYAAGQDGMLLWRDWTGLWHLQQTPGTATLYGVSGGNRPCMEFLHEAAWQGIDNGRALQLDHDGWHDPRYDLYCGNGSRRNFEPFDALEFLWRSPDPEPGDPTFHIQAWNRQSQTLHLTDYIEGGVIDETWRQVSIPLADLKTPQWSELTDVETLVWNRQSAGHTAFVDNIRLKDRKPPVAMALNVESSTVLSLQFDERYDPDSVPLEQHYARTALPADLHLPTPAYPVEVGRNFHPLRFLDGACCQSLNRYEVFLRFAQPMQTGRDYRLRVSGVRDCAQNEMAPRDFVFHYDERRLRNRNIKVNQVGYLPELPKFGYVGGYLGDLGGRAWAVGDAGLILAWDARGGWQRQASPVTTALYGVAAIHQQAVWAVGAAGVVLHGDGRTWHREPNLTTADLRAVTFGPTRIGWAVGQHGTSLKSASGQWTAIDTPTSHTLFDVWAGPADTAWAVGAAGTILRWQDSHWTLSSDVPTSNDLLSLCASNAQDMWAVGVQGTVLHYEYGYWNLVSDFPENGIDLTVVLCNEFGQVWIGGEQGRLFFKAEFGPAAFTPVDSSMTGTWQALARLDARQLWGVAVPSLLLENSTGAWQVADLTTADLHDVFALQYGPLRLPEPLPEVILQEAESGQPVMAVPLELQAANWYLSGEDVYAFDFTALDRPGRYRAFVAGLGLSDPFVIGSEVLNPAAYVTARGLYYQRCGTALDLPYADPAFVRPRCHEYDLHGRRIDAAFHDSLPSSPLYHGEVPGDMMDGHGGWHDAGDFGKYMNRMDALWPLLLAYDLGPQQFPDNVWNIPESGNGVPDLLDEIRWQTDWVARMVAEDGGAYSKLTSQCWFEGMPQEEQSPRYLFERSTAHTASAAAVLASAARLWQPYDSALAAQYLAKAERAWTFLQQHPEDVPTGGVINPPGNCSGPAGDPEDDDNRLWAAAELYRTTGQSGYRQWFDDWWDTHVPTWGWPSATQYDQAADWAYLQASWPDADAETQEWIRTHFVQDAEAVAANTFANPYRNGDRLLPFWIGWGAFSQSTRYALVLLRGYFLSGDETFRQAAGLNLDAQLGANPLALSFITGLGQRYPKDPLDMESIFDSTAEPVPGIPVFGVAAHMSNAEPYYREAQSDGNNYPYAWNAEDPYPILRRFLDERHVVEMAEFTIAEMATAAAVFGLLAKPRACYFLDGRPVRCDDGNACTFDDCHASHGCYHKVLANGTPCVAPDSVFGICQTGQCVGLRVSQFRRGLPPDKVGR